MVLKVQLAQPRFRRDVGRLFLPLKQDRLRRCSGWLSALKAVVGATAITSCQRLIQGVNFTNGIEAVGPVLEPVLSDPARHENSRIPRFF
jgi:hypothetical protein